MKEKGKKAKTVKKTVPAEADIVMPVTVIEIEDEPKKEKAKKVKPELTPEELIERSKYRTELKKKIGKLSLVLVMLAGFTIGMYFIFRIFGFDVVRGTVPDIEGQMAALAFTFIGLYILQSLTLNLIPGTTTVFISGLAFYGLFNESFLYTYLISVAAVLLASIALYFFGKYAGRRLLYWLFNREALDKRLNWFERNGTKGVPWLFLIPLFPTDLLCLTCGAAKMRFWQYMLIVVVFRPIEVAILLIYATLWSQIMDTATIFEQILLVNALIVNIVLLVIYHRALLNLFNKTFNPRKYNQEQKEAQAAATAAAIDAYKAAIAAHEAEKAALAAIEAERAALEALAAAEAAETERTAEHIAKHGADV